METIAKPDELLALHGWTAELFATLRRWFEVPPSVALDLVDIDSAVAQLGDPTMVMAMAMRKLQALRLLSTPGVRTSTDVVVTIVQDLDRALLQAPAMRLKVAAASTDWDAAFEDLVAAEDLAAASGGADPTSGDVGRSDLHPDGEDDDPEVERFREGHGRLHAALAAVIRASDGEIRYLV